MRKTIVLILFLFLFSFAFSVQAGDFLDVVINEIAWMGTEENWQNEWIELYNNTNQTINLDGWILKAGDETPNITLAGIIPAKRLFLLERTDDDTLPGVLADQIYKGSLENSGENLQLFDNTGNLIDSVDCSDGWFAGNNQTKQTMERRNPNILGSDPKNWQTSQNPGGTPKAENILTGDSPRGTAPQTPDLAESGSPPLNYPFGIVINEILPSPQGPDAEEEWIEISNNNDFEVDISEWQIKDKRGQTKTYTFPKGTKIIARGFLVLKRPTSKITLNNDGDGLILIRPDDKIIDELSYEKAPLGQSYSLIESGWIWSSNLTPGFVNSKLISVPEENEKQTKENYEKIERNKNIATVSQQIEEVSFFPLLIALATAVFSAIIILILKIKVRKEKPEQ